MTQSRNVAGAWAPGFRLALVLAYETGHRIGAIRQLRWSDIDFEREVIRWRVQHDKVGLEHETPMSVAAKEALWGARQQAAAIGDRWVFRRRRTPKFPSRDFSPMPGGIGLRSSRSCRRSRAAAGTAVGVPLRQS